MIYNLNIHRQHHHQNECFEESFHTGSGTHHLHSVHMTHLMFTSYFVTQHMTDTLFSSSVFNFFLLLFSEPLLMRFEIIQPSNCQLNFGNPINSLPVFTSSTSNSKRFTLFLSHFCSCSILAVFVPTLSLYFILAS